jgi:hypothetical protein
VPKRPPRYRPELQPLEDRLVLSLSRPAVINYPTDSGPYENAFVTMDDGNLYYRFFDGSNWQNWVPLGHPNNVPVYGVPAVINYGNGYENAFVTGSDDNLYYRFFDGSNWQNWVSLGNPGTTGLSDPAVINYGNGYENAFVTGNDGSLHYTYFDGSNWQGWVNLGHPNNDVFHGVPAVINYPTDSGPYENAFVTGSWGNLYYRFFDGSNWQGWVNLGHPVGTFSLSDPAVINYGNGYENAFVTGSTGNLYYTYFDGSSWQGWVNLGWPGNAVYGVPGVINYGNGYENVFVTTWTGALTYTYFDGSNWQGWVGLSHPAQSVWSDPAVINYGNGYENAFVTGSDGNLYYKYYDGSHWQGWVNLGNPGLGAGPSMGSDSRPSPSEKVGSVQPLPQNQETPLSSVNAAGPHRDIPLFSKRQPLNDLALVVPDSEWQFLESLGWLPAAEVDQLAGLASAH